MMHGKPVVSHLGGNWPQAQKEVLGEYADTYVCKNDADRYSILMLKLLLDKQEYDAYSSYVKKRAEELYDYKAVTKEYVEVYNSLV